jgi:hypothetical protein
MRPRVKRHIAESDERALAAFVSKKVEIDAMLARLRALSDDHFNYSPDEIDWGHVGTPRILCGTAEAVTDSAFKEGECAE